MFTKPEVLAAADTAYAQLLERKGSLGYFIRGYSDCWSLVCLYDSALKQKEAKLSSLNFTTYTDDYTFIKLVVKQFKDFDGLATFAGYKRIRPVVPVVGDIAVYKNVDGRLGFKIALEKHWLTSNLGKGNDTIPDIFDIRTIHYLYRPINENI